MGLLFLGLRFVSSLWLVLSGGWFGFGLLVLVTSIGFGVDCGAACRRLFCVVVVG